MPAIHALAVALWLALLCCLIVVGASLSYQQVTRPAVLRCRTRLDARRRAEALLRGVLSPDEYEQLEVEGYLSVPSRSHPDRIYEIPRDCGAVTVREDGKVVGGLCLRAVEPIPAADAVALHKLMLEGAEEDYLRQANPIDTGMFVRCCLGMLHDP